MTHDPVAVRTLLAAAPQLEALTTSVRGSPAEIIRLLRDSQRLRATAVRLLLQGARRADALEAAAAVAEHAWVTQLDVTGHDLVGGDDAGLNALMDAALTRRVHSVLLRSCRFAAENVPALFQLLRCGCLTLFRLHGCWRLDAHTFAQLSAALRDARTLTAIEYVQTGVFEHGGHAALLDALQDLPALHTVSFLQERAPPELRAALSRALGALLAADPPSLRKLSVAGCSLGDEDVAPLLDGLALNTHLRHFNCEYNDLTEAFERDRVAPALAALAARPAAQ